MENDIATNQQHAMIGSTNILAWDRVSSLQTLLERRFFQQEIHWIQRTKQSWFLLGDRNNKFFQTIATIRKRQNSTFRIRDTQGIWYEDQQEIIQTITKEFERRFRKDNSINLDQAIPLSRDSSDADNDYLRTSLTKKFQRQLNR